MEHSELAKAVGDAIGNLTAATARAVATLAEAVANQPGIDREALLKEWLTALPPLGATSVDDSLFRAIEHWVSQGSPPT